MLRFRPHWFVRFACVSSVFGGLASACAGSDKSEEQVDSIGQPIEGRNQDGRDDGDGDKRRRCDATIDSASVDGAHDASEDEANTCRRLVLTASRTYKPARWTDGTAHEHLTFAIPSDLVVTAGNSGNHFSTLTFALEHHEPVTCSYRGGSHEAHPTTPAEIAKAQRYVFFECDEHKHVGQIVTADHVELHVQNGDNKDPANETAIRIELDDIACADAGTDARPDVASDAPTCTPMSCDDQNPCTTDTCAANGTCQHAPTTGAACSDGNACTLNDVCTNGTCSGTAVHCAAQDACHIAGACNPATGACSSPPAPDGTACNDGNACTQGDTCQNGACFGTNPIACSALDQCHLGGICDPASGICSNPRAPDGTTCSDSDACTLVDSCMAGVCTGADPVVCSPLDQCHVAGTCDPSSGTCSNPAKADGITCNDNDAYTQGDVCVSGSCSAGTPVTCVPQDACHSAGTCSPATGVCSNPAIPGCDPTPTTTGGALEPRASLIGRVVTTSGAPFTGYAVTVFDAPAGPTPRSDVVATMGADGSFRVRLTAFPTSEPDQSPPHPLMMRIDSPGHLPALREAFAHPGAVLDLGTITLADRDPGVTVIGTGGGVARDAQNLVEVNFPPGALASDTPITITSIPTRAAVPFPLPDGSATTYAMVFEPDGLTFPPNAQPTVRLVNWRNRPIHFLIPVASLDAATGTWMSEGYATWDGARFAFTISHFSTWDANHTVPSPPIAGGGPPPPPPPPPPPCGSGGGGGPNGPTGVGSSASIASGTLAEDITLPGYQAMGRNYGVSLHYDALHTFGVLPSDTADGYAAAPLWPVTAKFTKFRVSMGCQARPTSDGIPFTAIDSCTVPTPCTASSPMQELRVTVNTFGKVQTAEFVPPPGAKDWELPTPVAIPKDDAGQVSQPYFVEQTVSLFPRSTTTCIGSGGAFGSNSVADLQPAPLTVSTDPSPFATFRRQVFVGHRHTSPYGVGWSINGVGTFVRSPSADEAVLFSPAGQEEHFAPRATTRLLPGFFGSGTSHRARRRDRRVRHRGRKRWDHPIGSSDRCFDAHPHGDRIRQRTAGDGHCVCRRCEAFRRRCDGRTGRRGCERRHAYAPRTNTEHERVHVPGARRRCAERVGFLQ